MKPSRNIERILVIIIAFIVVFLLFELYWFLLIPVMLVSAGIFSEKKAALIVDLVRKTGSFITGKIAKFIILMLFLIILLPIAITQVIISKL